MCFTQPLEGNLLCSSASLPLSFALHLPSWPIILPPPRFRGLAMKSGSIDGRTDDFPNRRIMHFGGRCGNESERPANLCGFDALKDIFHVIFFRLVSVSNLEVLLPMGFLSICVTSWWHVANERCRLDAFQQRKFLSKRFRESGLLASPRCWCEFHSTCYK